MQAAENQYYSNLFDTTSHNVKSIWSSINNLINPNKTKSSNIANIIEEGITYDDPLAVASIFNKYFTEVASTLTNSTNTSASFSPSFLSYLKKPLYLIVSSVLIYPVLN